MGGGFVFVETGIDGNCGRVGGGGGDEGNWFVKLDQWDIDSFADVD